MVASTIYKFWNCLLDKHLAVKEDHSYFYEGWHNGLRGSLVELACCIDACRDIF